MVIRPDCTTTTFITIIYSNSIFIIVTELCFFVYYSWYNYNLYIFSRLATALSDGGVAGTPNWLLGYCWLELTPPEVSNVCGKPRGFVFIYIATTDGSDHCAWVRRLEIQQARPDSVFTLSGRTRQLLPIRTSQRAWLLSFLLVTRVSHYREGRERDSGIVTLHHNQSGFSFN